MALEYPPAIHNSEGRTRAVGFELELAGIGLDEAAGIVQRLFGGAIEWREKSVVGITGTQYGDFSVEIDSRFLKDGKYRELLDRLGTPIRSAAESLEELLVNAAALFVPTEVICPPIPLDRIEAIERLREALNRYGAKGSKASILYGFGMQINVEPPDLDAGTLLQYLRAFSLLYEWLERELDIDLTRRLLPYINRFPDEYVELVLDLDYTPDLDRLLDDYLRHNPTRNRPLDMLPLFAFLDEEKVLSRAEERDLIKKRPAFHYRLPNCLIDDPAWSIAREWNYWVQVERLSASPDKVREMSRDCLETRRSFPGSFGKRWLEKVSQWLSEGGQSRSSG